jgi:hypothetical protein
MEDQDRIHELEDALKEAERKLAAMKTERDEAIALVDRADEVADDANAVLENWKHAFEMELNENGLWITPLGAVHDRYLEALTNCSTMAKKWNRFVPRYNAAILQRPIGRPLEASEAQQKQVFKHHHDGMSLRAIAAEMSLSLRTVRTIIAKEGHVDRATIKRLEKVDPMNAALLAAKARKRSRDALPKKIKAVEGDVAGIKKAVKGLGAV